MLFNEKYLIVTAKQKDEVFVFENIDVTSLGKHPGL
jgi:hypothetical protein